MLPAVFAGRYRIGLFKAAVKETLIVSAHLLQDALYGQIAVFQKGGRRFQAFFHLNLFEGFAGLLF